MTENEIKLMEVQISKISLAPGEYLFMEFPEYVNRSNLEQWRRGFRKYAPELAPRVLMYSGPINLSKVKLEDFT